MDFDQAVKRWVKALNKSDQYFRRAIVENQEEILDLNVAQLEMGKDSMGAFLMEYAHDTYAQFKKALGSKAPFGIPDLKLEGDFTEGFVLIAEGDAFVIDSTDEKSNDLRVKYGEDIFGLTEQSYDQIRPALLESWIMQLRNELS